MRMPQTACMAAQSIRPSHMIARLSLRKVYNEVHNSKGIAIASTKSEDLVSCQIETSRQQYVASFLVSRVLHAYVCISCSMWNSKAK